MLYLYFFPDSNPSGPLINRLKCFQIIAQFRRDIRSQSCVQHTVEGNFFYTRKKKTHDFPIHYTPFFPPPHFWRIITQVFMREYSTHWPWADASPASGHPPSAGHPVLPHPASPAHSAQELSWPHSSGFGILSLSSISRSDKTFFNWQKRRRKNCCSTIKKELFLSITSNIIIWSRHQTISGSG